MTENDRGSAPRSPLTFSIMTLAEGKPGGYDSAIIKVPGGWYAAVAGGRALRAQLVGRELRAGSERIAAGMGEKLHHAEWTITSDPDEVRTLGLMHDCVTCRAGVDQALAFLRDNPGGEVAVGQLWWAQPLPQAAVSAWRRARSADAASGSDRRAPQLPCQAGAPLPAGRPGSG